jgi:WXG100 family type VII secretion target
MSIDGFYVQTDTLDQKSRQVGELVPRIQKQLTQLNTQMQEMFAKWEGRSSTGFRNLHGNWNRQYLQLNRQLDTISKNLGANNRGYIGADDNSMPTGGASAGGGV